jgi:hypothetical protein
MTLNESAGARDCGYMSPFPDGERVTESADEGVKVLR